MAGYGITTLPGLYHTMSGSPGSPAALEGAVGGGSASDPEDLVEYVHGLSIAHRPQQSQHKDSKEVKVRNPRALWTTILAR